ncbi:MAG: 4Fe-4S binding protein [Candidatus Omnitrophica bacterium]|nr:4Fe-4S binding protein [Candidatus Omnitrophota bacterium]MBU1853363.1 4Fe-4S binding protein [Candidatus Omnitrophota bacterium]
MKRLFIDLEKLYSCEDTACTCECSYYYHPNNSGITRLREIAQFQHTCRRCEYAPCVTSCPKDALEKQPDGVIKRYSMRCISCKSCSLACPFGIIPSSTIPYIISECDVCIDRCDKEVPVCVKTCSIEGAVKFIDIEPSEKDDIYLIGKNIAVYAKPWKKYHP